MTEIERILQAALDANQYDFVCRMALADHLIEIGDERGEGYRALAELERVPRINNFEGFVSYHWGLILNHDFASTRPEQLTWSWLEWSSHIMSAHFSHKSALDAASLAWMKMTKEQRNYAYKRFYRGAK